MMADMKIRLDPEQPSCLICDRSLNLLKTDHKTCYSFSLGKFKLISACSYCPDHKHFDGKGGRVIRYESNLAAMIVNKKHRVTFDLVVKIGRLRYDDHRQLGEIQSYLKCSSAKLDLPLSTVGMVAKRFLEFCQLLHRHYETKILEMIKDNGGYFVGAPNRCRLVGYVGSKDTITSIQFTTIGEYRKALNTVLKIH